MKTKAWGAVVMVAFAWVLWKKNYDADSGLSWEHLRAFESKKSCDKSAAEFLRRLQKNSAGGEITIGGNLEIYDKATGKLKNSLFFRCFPHDFDPRPRK